MLRGLDKRLRKLESRLLAERDKDEEFGVYFALFLLDALGYYFSDPKPGEAPETATARALGYEHEGEFNEAIKKDNNPEFDERYARPNCKQLFAKFGVDVRIADGQKIADAAKLIYAGLPVPYKATAPVMPTHDNVWRCRPIDLPTDRPSRNSRVFTLDIRRHFNHVPWGRQFIEFIDENGPGFDYENDARQKARRRSWPIVNCEPKPFGR
jgi:hypothetical protein